MIYRWTYYPGECTPLDGFCPPVEVYSEGDSANEARIKALVHVGVHHEGLDEDEALALLKYVSSEDPDETGGVMIATGN